MAQCEAIVAYEKSPNFGNRCKRNAVRGATTCAAHGGVETTTTPELVNPNPYKRKCTATNNRGEPCENWANHGTTVCNTHGGQLPSVKQAARDRLAALVDPAISVIEEIMAGKNPGNVAAGDRLRAANMTLNRTGFHEKAEITHEVKPWEGLVANVLRDGGEDEGDDSDVIDAEVIDPDEERERLDAILRQAGVDPSAHEDDLRPEQTAFPPAETADVVPMKRRASADPPAHLRRVRR